VRSHRRRDSIRQLSRVGGVYGLRITQRVPVSRRAALSRSSLDAPQCSLALTDDIRPPVISCSSCSGGVSINRPLGVILRGEVSVSVTMSYSDNSETVITSETLETGVELTTGAAMTEEYSPTDGLTFKVVFTVLYCTVFCLCFAGQPPTVHCCIVSCDDRCNKRYEKF